MPIYEYHCDACGEPCEILQKFNDAPATACPNCHENKLKKLVSASAFHLKGSGWYVTDFKDKPKSNLKKTEDNTEKKVDNKESNQSSAKDSKPDAKKTESD